MYTTYKQELEAERYLDCISISKYFVALVRLRCSNHVLEREVGRHRNLVMTDRNANCIDREIMGDEYYFIMQCSAYGIVT